MGENVRSNDLKEELADGLHAALLSALLDAKLLPVWRNQRVVVSVSFLALSKTLGRGRRDYTQNALERNTRLSIDELADLVRIEP